MKERKRDPAMFPVDRKIGIKGQDSMPVMDFGHAHNARVG
jgi:hypothetical protein